MSTAQSLPAVSRKIGEHEYRVTRLGFAKWRELLGLVQQIAGHTLVSVLGQGNTRVLISSLLDAPAGEIAEALLGLVQRFAESDRVLQLLGEHTVVEQQRLSLQAQDFWWPQHPSELFEWLAFCLEVQFYDFFVTPGRKLLKKLNDPQEMGSAVSGSPSTLTGSFGE